MSSRAGGRQNLSELKLRRILEHNQRLREDLARPRVKVSEASASLIRYCKATKDHLVCHAQSLSSTLAPVVVSLLNVLVILQVPSVWGPVGRAENPYEQQTEGKCCTIQ
ncbi:hypothetical protein BDQ17DRAFT_1440538 [Cyathus striatus]|nr:hypothetical protein BDQ17DRAFT_1440538 [Cyathus striatus]